MGFLALLAAPAGCATSNSGSETGRRAEPSEGTSLQARGDWNDVEAAAVQGCNDAEVVVHDTLKVDQHKIEYAIRTVDDQTGVLTFTRLDSRAGSEGGAQGEGAEISVFCRVGDFGDAERERRVVREVADRLRQLQGVDFAPAR